MCKVKSLYSMGEEVLEIQHPLSFFYKDFRGLDSDE